MKKITQKLTLFSFILIVAASCSTLPEDPRDWEKRDYRLPVSNAQPAPSKAKFYSDLDKPGNDPVTPGNPSIPNIGGPVTREFN